MRVCKHGCVNTPPLDFQNVSFDWSVEKSHCQINVEGRYVLLSKMNFFFIFSHVVVFRGSYFIIERENIFPVFVTVSTVMQTFDFVSGLHNCLEFSQPLSCLYQAMQTLKTFSVAFKIVILGSN